MIVLSLKVNNLYQFEHFDMNLSYPKKIVDSTILNEHLEGHPNFRYKKAIILMGANATGKTTLGRVFMSIFAFMAKKDYGPMVAGICNKRETALFCMDFVQDNILYRISTEINSHANDMSYSTSDFLTEVSSIKILANDSYESCVRRLEERTEDHATNYIDELDKIPSLTWLFEFPFDDPQQARLVNPVNFKVYGYYLEKVLCILDPRITKVDQVKENETTYVIRHQSFNIVMDNGQLVKPQLLSSGTRDGIGIANLIATMKLHACSFYYCDEQFSHVHSDVEKAFLSLLIDTLGPNEQMFFTTHNSDLLTMNLPKHTYAFLVRDPFAENHITCVFASDYLKKSTDSLKNAVENDLFSSSPDTDSIYDLINQ